MTWAKIKAAWDLAWPHLKKLGPLLKPLILKLLLRPSPYPGRDHPDKPNTEDSIKNPRDNV